MRKKEKKDDYEREKTCDVYKLVVVASKFDAESNLGISVIQRGSE